MTENEISKHIVECAIEGIGARDLSAEGARFNSQGERSVPLEDGSNNPLRALKGRNMN